MKDLLWIEYEQSGILHIGLWGWPGKHAVGGVIDGATARAAIQAAQRSELMRQRVREIS